MLFKAFFTLNWAKLIDSPCVRSAYDLDRKKICADLYLSAWSMPKMAELLKVSSTTVWRDLQGFTDVKPPDPKRGGRPKKKSDDNPKSSGGPDGGSGVAGQSDPIPGVGVNGAAPHVPGEPTDPPSPEWI